MHLNIPLCLSFLGALASFSSVSARATYGHHYQLAERDADLISIRDKGVLDLRDDSFLDLRDEDHLDMRDDGFLDIRGVEELYDILVRRAKISAPQAAARKAAQRAAANRHHRAPHALTAKLKGAKVIHAEKTASQRAANARSAARKAANSPLIGVPGGHQIFQVPGRPNEKYTGYDVRKAVWSSHMHRPALQQLNADHAAGTLSNSQYNRRLKKLPLRTFENNAHRLPHPGEPAGSVSLPHMTGTGHEHPLGPLNPKGPARVITQQQPDGRTKFMGVVAHDVTRGEGDVGRHDHFQVHPTVPTS